VVIMAKPRTLIIRTAGTNCDYETKMAFELAGSTTVRVHINDLISGKEKLSNYQLLAIPGGFSYGDDIASGKILANEVKNKLGAQIREFAFLGKPIIGICNGFQVLVKMGLLPDEKTFSQSTTLTFNDSDKFECRWVKLQKAQKKTLCIWTKDLPEFIELPVAHGEGKFVAANKLTLEELEKNNQVVLRYSDGVAPTDKFPLNPNGSQNAIAGICNKKGNVFGLMPHPERYIWKIQHPSRKGVGAKGGHGDGLQIFINAVNYVK